MQAAPGLQAPLAALNLLAFAWHSALDIVEPPWQAARQAAAHRLSFFTHILIDELCRLPLLSALLEALTIFTISPEPLQTQKVE